MACRRHLRQSVHAAIGQSNATDWRFLWRQHEVGPTRANGGVRHAVILGRLRLLGNRDATGGLDGLDSARTIGTGAGEDNADGVIFPVVGEAHEKAIHRRLGSDRVGRLADSQLAVGDGDIRIRWRDIDGVGQGRQVVAGFQYLEPSLAGKELDHQAAMIRRHVLRHDIRHVGVRRQIGDKGTQRLQAPGRGADSDVVKWFAFPSAAICSAFVAVGLHVGLQLFSFEGGVLRGFLTCRGDARRSGCRRFGGGRLRSFFASHFNVSAACLGGTPLSGDIFHRTRTACAVESLKAGANNYRPLMRAIASLWIQLGKPCELSLKSASFVAVVDGGVELRGVFCQRDINWGRRVPCAEAVFASSCPSLQSIGEGRGWS